MFCLYFFFFKQKTAYEMRISDWSSDVCSSDLQGDAVHEGDDGLGVSEEQVVEAIFGVEEGARFHPILRPAFREHADIAAGAEAAAFAMVDDDRLDRVVTAPSDERADHRVAQIGRAHV